MKNDLEENWQIPIANELVYLIRDNRFWMVSAATRGATAATLSFIHLYRVSRWTFIEAGIGESGSTKRYRAVVWEHEYGTRNRHRVSTSVHGYYAILK